MPVKKTPSVVEVQPIWESKGFSSLEEMVRAYEKLSSPIQESNEPKVWKTYEADYKKHNMTFKYLNDERIEFNNGYFRTDNPVIQQAIQSTDLFKQGRIRLVTADSVQKQKIGMGKGVITSQSVGNTAMSKAEEFSKGGGKET